MAVETAVYIADLDKSLPQGANSPKEGDDHIRKVKEVLTNTLPNVAGVVSATHSDLSTLAGAASTGAAPNVATQPAGSNNLKAASTAFVADAIATTAAANSGPLVMWSLMKHGVI